MMNVQIFKNQQFGQIRTVAESGKILFCGSDIARALGYARPNEAVAAHAKGTVKRRTLTNGGEQEMVFITEGDVYRLIVRSKLPSAEQFEHWVFDDVLPSIRKHGIYATPMTIEQMIADPANAIKILSALKQEQEKRRALESKVAEDAPKVLFADAVATAKTTILIGDLAKLIRQNGIEIGQNRLFQWLRDNGFLCTTGERYNLPTQKAMELELFEVKESVIANPDGSTRITRTTKVTGKGQTYFVNKFLA
jgi:prophage antirepressor-like protein